MGSIKHLFKPNFVTNLSFSRPISFVLSKAATVQTEQINQTNHVKTSTSSPWPERTPINGCLQVSVLFVQCKSTRVGHVVVVAFVFQIGPQSLVFVCLTKGKQEEKRFNTHTRLSNVHLNIKYLESFLCWWLRLIWTLIWTQPNLRDCGCLSMTHTLTRIHEQMHLLSRESERKGRKREREREKWKEAVFV